MESYVTPQNLQVKTEDWLRSVAQYNRPLPELTPQKCALIVIDMQNDFLLEDSPFLTPGGLTILPNTKRLITACRGKGVPVIYTAHVHENPQVDGGLTAEWWPELKMGKALVSGTKGAEIHSDLVPQKGEKVVRKHRYSAFYNTDLETVLRCLGIEDLIVTGVMTNICCESTARDAFYRDFRVFFLADATGTIKEDLHLGSLRALAYAFAWVTTTDDILRALRARETA